MKISSILLGIILGGMALPISAYTWDDAKNAALAAARDTIATIKAKPAYAVGALAVGAASWFLYKKYDQYKRTYYIGDEKFIAPQGALVTQLVPSSSRFKYKTSFYCGLPSQKLHLIRLMQGNQRSNTLQVFHPAYENSSGVRIIIHSDTPYSGKPIIGISDSDAIQKTLKIRFENSESACRIDYIFLRPISCSGENYK